MKVILEEYTGHEWQKKASNIVIEVKLQILMFLA